MSLPVATVTIRHEHDVVSARQRARQIATLFGFQVRDQVRVATAVSEIARNAFKYAGQGRVEFSVRIKHPQVLEIKISDRGRGIPNLAEILDGRYVSPTGMGIGILGARRLMEEFSIESAAGQGTTVVLKTSLPKNGRPVTRETISEVALGLTRDLPQGPLGELQQQNQELLATLDELQKRQTELAELNKELEDTNRGVVALYAELDERADYLRRASELKSQFLSNMTHEFRTPVNSVLSLCRILLDRLDGDLSNEQERQVKLIEKSANELSEIVNDLLDLAKVEAGKTIIRPSEFTVESLFGALRGMLRPLLSHNNSVSLTFEENPSIPPLLTDESKVSQILRNLISNALKYTEAGEVRVRARVEPGEWVVFSVSDTGVGIADTDQEMIFEEFTQVEGSHQIGKKGTGLGLPLSRKLAELLGGTLTVRSATGAGSTFELRVPSEYRGPTQVSVTPDLPTEVDPTRLPVLVVEDNRETMFIYEKFLKGSGYQPIPARTLKQAREFLAHCRPVAIILDILLSHENTWNFLSELKADPATREIPVFVITVVENRQKAMALGAQDFQPKPVDREWLLRSLRSSPRETPAEEILIVDDDEQERGLLRGLLVDTRFQVIEASDGSQGLLLASRRKPAAIIMDVLMPGLDGLEALRLLRSDPATKHLPVVIHTGKVLTEQERGFLASQGASVLAKHHIDREVSLRRIREALANAGVQRSS